MSDNAAMTAPGGFCPACGAPVLAGARFCPSCGAAIASGAVMPAAPMGRSVFCRACGRAINEAAPFCPGCGAPQRPRAGSVEGEKSRIAAALLALFLGGLGIHKFYLGRPVQGILYILFCWTFIPALIGMIEGIVYLCMSDAGFARSYG